MIRQMLSPLISNMFWTQNVLWGFHSVAHRQIVLRSNEFWQSLKGKYAGRRGFVVGNGPSLKMEDLEAIKDEISIASNKIYLAFEQTAWRPMMITCGDPLVWKKAAREICQNTERPVLTSNIFPGGGDRRKLVFARNIGPSLRAEHGFSTDLIRGVYVGSTITFVNMQIAAHLGLNPIYLIGCDHYYGGAQHSGGKVTKSVEHGAESHHFHKDYRMPGEVVLSAPIDLMNRSYALAHQETQRLGIQVFNATRGGFLEAFQRVNFDEVVSKKN